MIIIGNLHSQKYECYEEFHTRLVPKALSGKLEGHTRHICRFRTLPLLSNIIHSLSFPFEVTT